MTAETRLVAFRTVDDDDEVHTELVEVSTDHEPPFPHPIEASLLTTGDLIVLPDYVERAGEQIRVGRAFPFQGGATVELEDGAQVVLSDDQPVTLLATGGSLAIRHQDWPAKS